MALVEQEVLKIDPVDGRSYLNELLLSKITAAQSGIPGSLVFPNELGADIELEIEEFRADIEFKLSNMTISNLDSLGAPLQLIQPIAPQSLNNTLAIGVGEELEGSLILTFGFSDGRKYFIEAVY